MEHINHLWFLPGDLSSSGNPDICFVTAPSIICVESLVEFAKVDVAVTDKNNAVDSTAKVFLVSFYNPVKSLIFSFT